MSHLGATVPFRDGAQRKGKISRQLFAIIRWTQESKFSPKHCDWLPVFCQYLGVTVSQLLPWFQGTTSHKIHLDLLMCSFWRPENVLLKTTSLYFPSKRETCVGRMKLGADTERVQCRTGWRKGMGGPGMALPLCPPSALSCFLDCKDPSPTAEKIFSPKSVVIWKSDGSSSISASCQCSEGPPFPVVPRTFSSCGRWEDTAGSGQVTGDHPETLTWVLWNSAHLLFN